MQVWLERGDGFLKQKPGLFSVSCAPVTTIKHTVFRESFAVQRLKDRGTELTGTDFFRQVAYVEIWNLLALNEPEEADRSGDGSSPWKGRIQLTYLNQDHVHHGQHTANKTYLSAKTMSQCLNACNSFEMSAWARNQNVLENCTYILLKQYK